MRNRKTREIALVLVLFAAFIMVSVFTSNTTGLTEPDYTVFSSTDKGAMLLYDTLKHMGYPVKISTLYVTPSSNTNNLQIIIEPYSLDDEKIKDLADWVARGGRLLYFDSVSENGYFINQLLKIYPPDNVNQALNGTEYSIGFGKILKGYSPSITNMGLYETDGQYGQYLADYLGGLEYGDIYFNEAYHGYEAEKDFFDSLPGELKIIFYQILLLTIASALYLGRRFGKITPFYEEIEREENEYVYTLSNLYMSTGMGNAALSAYDAKFLSLCSKNFRTINEQDFDEICYYWKNENLENYDKLIYIKENRFNKINSKRKSGQKELRKTAEYYRALIKTISRL